MLRFAVPVCKIIFSRATWTTCLKKKKNLNIVLYENLTDGTTQFSKGLCLGWKSEIHKHADRENDRQMLFHSHSKSHCKACISGRCPTSLSSQHTPNNLRGSQSKQLGNVERAARSQICHLPSECVIIYSTFHKHNCFFFTGVETVPFHGFIGSLEMVSKASKIKSSDII